MGQFVDIDGLEDLVGISAADANAGLRARKRRRTAAIILDAAASVFAEKGFDGSKVEDIAAVADVSLGTVYGYFATKENLLLALVVRHRHTGAERRKHLVEQPVEDPIAALTDYECAIFDASLGAFELALWSRVVAGWLMQGQTGLGKLISDMENGLVDERKRLLEVLQQRGSLPDSMDVQNAADTVHAVNFRHWIRLVTGEHDNVEAAKNAAGQQAGLLLKLFSCPA